MAEHRMNPTATTLSGGPVDAYLAELAQRLRGPRRLRRRILAELRAGLGDAVDDNRAAGMADARAQTEAVAGFGSPQAVAEADRARAPVEDVVPAARSRAVEVEHFTPGNPHL